MQALHHHFKMDLSELFYFVELKKDEDPVSDFDVNKFSESLDKKQRGKNFIFYIFFHSN